MRKLIRILLGATLLAGLAFAVPPPVSADHGAGSAPTAPEYNSPCTASPSPYPDCWGPDGVAGTADDLVGAVHEPIPTAAVAIPAVPCVVHGEVVPGTPGGGTNHEIVPVINNATHSHFSFVDSTIACTDTGPLAVTADGGNDGHLLDLDGGGVPHPFDDHHGSTNESGWSHSSLYSGGSGGGESNACTTGPANRNKGDISAGTSSGWVKYIRVATVLYVWGCFTTGPLAADNPYFSAVLAISAPSTAGIADFPECMIPEVPGVTPPPPSCGFSIAGVAYRGPGWSPAP